MTRHASLDASVEIETPEQVAFSYTLAGAGARALAAFVDYLLCLIALIGLVLIVQLLFGGVGRVLGGGSSAWVTAALVLVQFVILWGYYVLFEGLNDGRTPGKSWLGLRVVQDGGFSVSFAASAIRNIARVIDLQPGFFSAVGLISIAVSKSGKRVGDMLAGTIVVRERVVRSQTSAFVKPAADTSRAPLQTLLTDGEYAVLDRLIMARGRMARDRRSALVTQLVDRFASRVTDVSETGEDLLVALHARERQARARGVAARSDTGGAREQHALVAASSGRWDAFAKQLARVQSRGLSNIPESEISDFVSRYREVTADLARLRTASRGRDVAAVFPLSRLVAAGHNVIYRQRALTPRRVLDYLSFTVPAEIRRSWRAVSLAAFLMFAPAIIAGTAVARHPAVAPTFIPQGMIERANQGVQRAAEGTGYIEDPELMRPVMASRIISNNVQVTFFAFAGGVTAGIMTVLLLVLNGVSIGGVFGLYQSKGILSLLLAFVAPHSVLELGAICIAGGGGLLVGAGLVLPGNRTRKEAFVANGRRAMTLIAGSTLMLVFAGTIEGLISPIPWWPLWWKVAVTAVTAVFFFGYIMNRGAE